MLLAILVMTGMTFAQEKSESKSNVVIKIVNDGKVVVDSTFSFDGDVDKEKIQKLIKKFSGDEVEMKWVDAKNNESFGFVYSDEDGVKHKDIKMKIIGGTAADCDHDEDCEGDEDCEHHVEIKSFGDGDKHGHENFYSISTKVLKDGGENEVYVIKKGDGDHSESFDIYFDEDHDHAKMKSKKGKFLVKEGNAFFHGDSGAVKIVEGKEDMVWISGKDENIKVDILSDGEISPKFFMSSQKSKKGQIELRKVDGGDYRLEFNSDELDPILVEVFDGEGKRLYKKKVKNFYGRYLKELPLEYNETGFYTVKVTQGDKEIIGEFEFK